MHVLVYLPLYWYGYLPASFQNTLTLTPYVQWDPKVDKASGKVIVGA